MGKVSSKTAEILGRLLKALIVLLLIPLVVSLLLEIRNRLEITNRSGATFRQWVEWGLVTYVTMHVLLYKPVAFFQASHKIFSTLAIWFFGGQVSSTDSAGKFQGKRSSNKKQEARESRKNTGSDAQSSVLVAFSPYVIPLYTILVCVLAALFRRWMDAPWAEGPLSFMIGFTIALQWLMTAEDLQQQRSRWHLETYLLAIGLVFVLTLIIAGACLPLAVPEFSFSQALNDAFARTQTIYASLVQQLFL